jgi:hypothetical protein
MMLSESVMEWDLSQSLFRSKLKCGIENTTPIVTIRPTSLSNDILNSDKRRR